MAIRVCIFDDNKSIRNSLELLLNDNDGIEVTGVYENANNIELDLTKSKPDLVFMDIEMEGVNGVEAVRRIKKISPDLTIIMLTIFEDEERIFSSILAGASGYLTKDAPPLAIVQAVKEAQLGGTPTTPLIAKKIFRQFQTQLKTVAPEVYHLTVKETDVLRSVADGLSYKMIADKLGMGYDTVRTHIKAIYRKLHVASMGEAISKAIRGKII